MLLRVCAGVASSASLIGAPEQALDALAGLLAHTLPPNVLTTAHLDFVKLVLAERKFAPAVSVLEKCPLFSVAAGMQPTDALLFYYYAGLIFCGAELWARAAGMFRTVRTQ